MHAKDSEKRSKHAIVELKKEFAFTVSILCRDSRLKHNCNRTLWNSTLSFVVVPVYRGDHDKAKQGIR